MAGYEDAPATIMLATNCAACGLPLVDAKSVEVGMGPECRRKYGWNAEVSEEARAEANRLVYRIALEQGGVDVARGAERLRELGFAKLADRIVKRAAPIRIAEVDGVLEVRAPYSVEAVDAMRRVPGARWDAERKLRVVPASSRRALFAALVACYAGMVAVGPKGAFVIAAVPA